MSDANPKNKSIPNLGEFSYKLNEDCNIKISKTIEASFEAVGSIFLLVIINKLADKGVDYIYEMCVKGIDKINEAQERKIYPYISIKDSEDEEEHMGFFPFEYSHGYSLKDNIKDIKEGKDHLWNRDMEKFMKIKKMYDSETK